MTQNNGAGNDAKAGSAAAAGQASSSVAPKSAKSTHSPAAALENAGAGASPLGDLSAQQAAAQAAQAANPSEPAEATADASALSSVSGSASSLSSELVNAKQSINSDAVAGSEEEDGSAAGDTGQAAPSADGNSAVPGSLWNGSGASAHMLTSLSGKESSADAALSGGFGGSNGSPGSTSSTGGAFLVAARAAISTDQGVLSDLADKTRASDIPSTTSSDASLAAAQVSTTQVALAPGSAGATVASANVPYQMGSDAWRADVSSHVLYFSQQNIDSAELHLNPAHLSPLSISISIDNNQTSIAFSAAHEATRQAMQDSLPQLHELFNAHGIALGQTTVGDSSAGSAQQQKQRSSQTGSGNSSSASKARESSSTALNGGIGVRIRSLQIVDTFA